jgi:hypothetical protein
MLVARRSAVFVRSLTDVDRSWKLATLERVWGTTTVARLAELVDAAPFLASSRSMVIGVLGCSPTVSVPTASRWPRFRRLRGDEASDER